MINKTYLIISLVSIAFIPISLWSLNYIIEQQYNEIYSLDCPDLKEAGHDPDYMKSMQKLAQRKHTVYCEHGNS